MEQDYGWSLAEGMRGVVVAIVARILAWWYNYGIVTLLYIFCLSKVVFGGGVAVAAPHMKTCSIFMRIEGISGLWWYGIAVAAPYMKTTSILVLIEVISGLERMLI